MERRFSCARPGCQGLTGAWLTYDYAGQHVWLDDTPAPEGGDQWPLCTNHAARLRAPQGWTQVDRRVARPTPERVVGPRYEPPTALVS